MTETSPMTYDSTDLLFQFLSSGNLPAMIFGGILLLFTFLGRRWMADQERAHAERKDEIDHLRKSLVRVGEKIDHQQTFIHTTLIDVTNGYKESQTTVGLLLERVAQHLDEVGRLLGRKGASSGH